MLITMMAQAIGLAALTGYSDNSNELQTVVCEVESVNDGSPLVSAARNAGRDRIVGTIDDFVPIDSVPVIFRARAGNNNVTIPVNGTYSSFIITGGLASAKVPIDNDTMVSVLIAPLEMKQATWFRDILGGSPSFSASAQITFKGHVSGPDHEVEVPAWLSVNFIGTVVE